MSRQYSGIGNALPVLLPLQVESPENYAKTHCSPGRKSASSGSLGSGSYSPSRLKRKPEPDGSVGSVTLVGRWQSDDDGSILLLIVNADGTGHIETDYDYPDEK